MNPCAVPTPVADVDGDKRWQSIHRRFISDCREKDPDVIFLGDCIFETLQDTETWNQYFAPLHCLNFSIRDDCTEHVLWRIENGALDNVNPKIVVLHVGTNNVNNSAAEVTEGVLACVKKIREKLPGAYILIPVFMQMKLVPLCAFSVTATSRAAAKCVA
ncbi:platelet-activating factor acetylhydrolase IB subunit beta homolog isoform X2 [Scaptodrosophila lebanonensis]|uniref:Platelet-activating factor acetylhydrolase IB subunit beta homolog isoform X2 n=1 Tax=Drosophila lebanonensis TaxID=7225 RepID=A0A6J2TZN6_DROLE|nr:platelet-activating factor acetylhydrolase IB subunit beta homolog isoform X2 [Scaptodrosophila lebanonensis]